MHSFHYNDRVTVDATWDGTRYVNIHHNGDYSGDVVINVGVQRGDRDVHGTESEEIQIRFEAVNQLAAEYVRHEKIGKLEDAPDDQLLAEGEAELG